MIPDNEKIQDFAKDLRGSFAGEIRFDRYSRLLYSTDASIYQIEPLGVLIPRSHDDVAAAVSVAARYRMPLLSRGGGTSISGQTIGAAVVIDYSKYMNNILDVNLDEHRVRAQPGLVLDRLNAKLRGSGFHFGPDVSTSSRATLGGMIGNNSCGSHSIVYGKTCDHVRELKVLLADGTECRFSDLSSDEWDHKTTLNSVEGRLYRTVDRIVRKHQDEIRSRYPKIMRHVGGYSLDSIVPGRGNNLSRLMLGSEGTLATCTEVVVNLVPAPKQKALIAVHFPELSAAMDALVEILAFQPAAVELLDKMVLDLTRLQPAFARKMTFVKGDPAAILLVEFYGETEPEVVEKLEVLERKLRAGKMASIFFHAVLPEDQANIWAIRKAGLGMLSSIRGDWKPIAFIEDTAVAPERLSEYVGRFRRIIERYDARAAFYGHASVGCLHVRPLINLKKASEIGKMLDIATAVKDLVVEFKGAMSAEHGDGLVRSHWNRELFGDRLYAAFSELKKAFDPDGIMNPGKIVHAPPMTENLRYGAEYKTFEPATYFNFSREGGLAGAIEQCSGLGACRKMATATMCPSYMATMEEEHSTRGRANMLRAAISGRLPKEEFTSRRMFEVLDLCLECKACKTECPANVDMAKLKYEFLAHYNSLHGTPLRSYVFGNFAALSRIGSATAPLSNWILQSSPFRKIIQAALKIHLDRRLPCFAGESFSRWLSRQPRRQPSSEAPRVVLFNDTYINYNEPGIGKAALKLLEDTGAHVFIPDVVCCGRPMISKGLLDKAKENARTNVSILASYVEAGAYVVGCEPSCLLTLRDEYPDLLGTPEARKLAERSFMLEEYLVRQLDAKTWRPAFSETPRTIILHGHCHQKSLVGTAPLMRLLQLPPKFTVKEIDSGCCGMAGAFGYEKEHYEISMRIGEMSLFPAVRAAEAGAEIVASGISCRQQIQHGTGRKAQHFSEILADALITN